MDRKFRLVAPYTAKGDQPQAIDALAHGFASGMQAQTPRASCCLKSRGRRTQV